MWKVILQHSVAMENMSPTPYTVAYQRMHSSDQMMTVSDLAIQFRILQEAKVDFYISWDKGMKMEILFAVNAPMKVIDRETLNEGLRQHTI